MLRMAAHLAEMHKEREGSDMLFISIAIISFVLAGITLWAQHLCDIDIDNLEIGIFEKDLCIVH